MFKLCLFCVKYNICYNFYFLKKLKKKELLNNDLKAAALAMTINWIVTDMCLPFKTFQSYLVTIQANMKWNMVFLPIFVTGRFELKRKPLYYQRRKLNPFLKKNNCFVSNSVEIDLMVLKEKMKMWKVNR